MRKLFLFLLIPAILFSGELKKALLKAKKENKPLMVLVTAQHCKYCTKIKKTTLSNDEVKENLKGFLFAQIDKTSQDAKKYLPKTKYTPSIYFISPEFKIINTVKGYLNAYDFNMWIDDTRKKLGMNLISHSSTNSNSYIKPEKNAIWMYDIASAIDYASQTNKNIMIFIGSTKSKWSKKMENETLKNSKIEKSLDDFVWVKLNYGNKEAKKYGLNSKSLPTIYFMTANMQKLATAKGYFNVKNFMKWIRYAKSKAK